MKMLRPGGIIRYALVGTLFLLTSTMAEYNYTMPEGETYKTNGSSSDTIDWYKHVKWFISIISPQDLPVDKAMNLVGSNSNAENLKELIMEILKMEAGFIAFIIIGLLMFLIMFIGAFVSCCCFCCGRKYAPKPSKKSDKNRRIMYLVLSGLLLLLLVGILFMFASSKGVHNAMKRSQKSLNNNLDDANIFLRNTRMQIRYITDDVFGETIRDVQGLLTSVGPQVLNKLETDLETKTTFNTLKKAADDFSTAKTKCTEIEQYANDFQRLCQEVTALQDLQLLTHCPSSVAGCDDFATAVKAMKCDESEIEKKLVNLREQINTMGGVDLQTLYTETTNQFDGISTTVNTNINSTVEDVNKVLDDIKKSVKDTDRLMDDLTQKVSNITADAKGTIHDFVESKRAQDNNDYIYLGLNIIGGIILAVWILLALGVFCGALCYEKQAYPDERSCKSTSVGILFLLPVFWMFVFGSLLWLFSTLLFILGGHVEAYVCRPLYDEPEFKLLDKVLDAYGKYQNIEGSFLGDTMLDNSSIDLKPSEILASLKNDVPVFRALQLNRKFDIEDKLDYRKHYKDFEHTLDNIMEPNINVQPFPPKFGSTLEKAKNSFTMPDLDGLANTLNINNVKAAGLDTKFDKIPQKPDDDSYKELKNKTASVTQLSQQLENTNIAEKINALQTTQKNLQKSLEKVKGTMSDVEGKVNLKIKEAIKVITVHYPVQITEKVDSFVTFVNSSLNDHIAGCLPLWNVFDTARTVICRHIVDPLNGYWFGLGWCLVFLVPSMILAVYLSKHFRRLKYAKACSNESLLSETAPPYYQE